MICNIKNISFLNGRIIGLAYFLEDGTGEGWFKNLEDGLIGELGRIHVLFSRWITVYSHGIKLIYANIQWHFQMEYYI